MRLTFWRRDEVKAAKEAARHSREDRAEVDELVRALKARGLSNHFAEAVARAARGGHP